MGNKKNSKYSAMTFSMSLVLMALISACSQFKDNNTSPQIELSPAQPKTQLENPKTNSEECSPEFLSAYQAVQRIFVGTKELSQANRTQPHQQAVRACNELQRKYSKIACKSVVDGDEVELTADDYESECTDVQITSRTPVKPTTVSVDPDLLRGKVNFSLRILKSNAFSAALRSNRLKDNYVLYYIDGRELKRSPITVAVGCSLYTNMNLTANELAQDFHSVKRQVFVGKTSFKVLFDLAAKDKKINLLCFKDISQIPSVTLKLSEISRILGPAFGLRKTQ